MPKYEMPISVRKEQAELYGRYVPLYFTQNDSCYITVESVCRVLGIHPNKQARFIFDFALLSEEWVLITTDILNAHRGIDYVVDSHTLALPLKFLYIWLFLIGPQTVRPDLREVHVCYARLCMSILSDAFSGSIRIWDSENPKIIENSLLAFQRDGASIFYEVFGAPYATSKQKNETRFSPQMMMLLNKIKRDFEVLGGGIMPLS